MSDPDIRVGNTEREGAQRRLEEHFNAGRLDPHEYEDRRGQAGDAVTRADLDLLFSDLPSTGLPSTGPDGGSLPVAAASAVPEPGGLGGSARRGAATGIVAVAATALFFVTGRWQFLLLVPLVALLWTFVTGRED
jgi:hypothetical protein